MNVFAIEMFGCDLSNSTYTVFDFRFFLENDN